MSIFYGNPRCPRSMWQTAVDIIGFSRYKFQPEMLAVWDKVNDCAMPRPKRCAGGEMERVYELLSDDGAMCALRVMDLLKGLRMKRDPRYIKTPPPPRGKNGMEKLVPKFGESAEERAMRHAIDDANQFMEAYVARSMPKNKK